MNKDPAFLGRGWSLLSPINAYTGRAEMLDGEQDVQEALLILLLTRPGEQLMHPDYGCHLQDHIFEQMDATTEAAIISDISDAIMFHEPRVTLHDVHLVAEDWIEGQLTIALDYTIDQINTRSNVVFPFYIAEGTLLPATTRSQLEEEIYA